MQGPCLDAKFDPLLCVGWRQESSRGLTSVSVTPLDNTLQAAKGTFSIRLAKAQGSKGHQEGSPIETIYESQPPFLIQVF